MASVRLGRYEVEDYELPPLCMRCGARAVGIRLRRLRWCPGWVIVAIAFGVLPYFILSELMMKRMAVPVPCCKEHMRNPLWPTLVSAGTLLGLIAVAAGLMALLENAGAMAIIFAVAVLLFIVWMFAAIIIHTPAIRPTEITEKSITLKGVSEKFIDALDADRRGSPEANDEDRPRVRRRDRDEEDNGGYYDPDRRRRRRGRYDEDDR